MHNFKSHFWWDFLAYCTRPARVNLVMAFIGCLFDSFSVFLLNLKQQQNLMKIIFSCIHFPVWPYPPKTMKKLYGLTGMKAVHRNQSDNYCNQSDTRQFLLLPQIYWKIPTLCVMGLVITSLAFYHWPIPTLCVTGPAITSLAFYHWPIPTLYVMVSFFLICFNHL